MDKERAETETGGLSVVIPVYNRGQIVGRTLRSLAEQTRFPDAVIVVDNNSTDGSAAVVEEWRRALPESLRGRVSIVSEPRPGAARARQTGLDSVTTDNVMFFDSDDVMLPGHIERIYNMLALPGRPELVAWPITYVATDGESRKLVHILPSRLMDSNLLHATLCTAGYAVRTELVRRAGGWDTSLAGWDDIEMSHRILLLNPSTAVSTVSMVNAYVQGEKSITGADFTHREGEWEHVIDLMEQATDRSGYADKAHVKRLLAYRRVMLAAMYMREGNTAAALRSLHRGLQTKELNALQRLYLRIAYAVTSRGIPGAARPVPYLF